MPDHCPRVLYSPASGGSNPGPEGLVLGFLAFNSNGFCWDYGCVQASKGTLFGIGPLTSFILDYIYRVLGIHCNNLRPCTLRE